MNRSSLLLAAAMAALVAGCQQPSFPRLGFEAVSVGDDAAAVCKAMGDPLIAWRENWTYRDAEPFVKAVIQFDDGKVSRKCLFNEQQMRVFPELYYQRGIYCTWGDLRCGRCD